MSEVFTWVSVYGYPAIFGLLCLGILGLPVPDEFLLVFFGYLIYSHRLSALFTFLTAFAGATSGISLSYLIGRKIGLPLLQSKVGRYAHISDRQIQAVHDWFRRIGHWALFIGYFIPGVRHFTALVAGTSCLELPTFALYAYSGAAFWVTVFLSIGYFTGPRWRIVITLVDHNLKIAALGVAGLAAAYLAVRYWLSRRRDTRKGSRA